MAVRYALARKRAVELLTAANITEPPIPVETLAALIGATIRYEPFDGDLSGMAYRRSGEGAVIGVNSLQSSTRKRFTIAHELGHLILHDDDALHIDEHMPIGFRNNVSSLAIDDHEVEANQFAAELLMPADFIRTDLMRTNDNIEVEDIIERLSQRYHVSLQAMSIRLTHLKLVR